MRKRKKSPYSRTVKDAYIAYAEHLLEKHEDWWSRYEQRTSHYRIYSKVGNGVREMMSYPRFKAIIAEWFSRAQDYIINGQPLALGNSLGRIDARRVERNFDKKSVNWGATKRLWERIG